MRCDIQTFLPWPEFHLSAKVLDNNRLNKQRHEGWQLLQALADINNGIDKNAKPAYPISILSHPTTLMWLGYERSLARYVCAICVEWTKRGYHDRVEGQVVKLMVSEFAGITSDNPPWLGLTILHENHRARLLQKENNHYQKQEFGRVPPTIGNLWPTTLRHGDWVYMNEGKVVGRLMSEPTHRLATEGKIQCSFCNYWFNVDDLSGGRCPTCVQQQESIELITELRHGDLEEKALANELLGHITHIIHLTREGRL